MEISRLTIVTDQTYFYDFSYRLRVDRIAARWGEKLNTPCVIDVFGADLGRKKNVDGRIEVRDFTLPSAFFGRYVTFLFGVVYYALKRPKGFFVVENLLSALPLIFLHNRPFHFDLHGDVVDELRILNPRAPRALLIVLRWIEGYLLRRAVSISVCSFSHRILIQARLHRRPTPIEVVPNESTILPRIGVVDNSIFKEAFWRSRVVVYSGSALPWQQPDKIMLFTKVVCELLSTVNVLILSHDVDKFKLMATQFSVPESRVKIISVPHSQVSDYYRRCFAGLVFRDYSLTNLVASPTKIHEYLAAGLHVYYTGYIGDFGLTADSDSRFTQIDLDDRDRVRALLSSQA